jgi:hypothetical protein
MQIICYFMFCLTMLLVFHTMPRRIVWLSEDDKLVRMYKEAVVAWLHKVSQRDQKSLRQMVCNHLSQLCLFSRYLMTLSVPDIIQPWSQMNEYRAMLEWYWQGETLYFKSSVVLFLNSNSNTNIGALVPPFSRIFSSVFHHYLFYTCVELFHVYIETPVSYYLRHYHLCMINCIPSSSFSFLCTSPLRILMSFVC